jgi:hypothetical protein
MTMLAFEAISSALLLFVYARLAPSVAAPRRLTSG